MIYKVTIGDYITIFTSLNFYYNHKTLISIYKTFIWLIKNRDIVLIVSTKFQSMTTQCWLTLQKMREDVFILSYTVVPWDREDFILQTIVGSSIVHTISVRNCLQGIHSLTSFLPSLVAFHSRFSRVLLAVFALIFSFAQLSPFHHGGRTPIMHTSSRRQTTTAHSQARHGTARHGN